MPFAAADEPAPRAIELLVVDGATPTMAKRVSTEADRLSSEVDNAPVDVDTLVSVDAVVDNEVPRLAIDAATTVDWLATAELVAVSEVDTLTRVELVAVSEVDTLTRVELVAVSDVDNAVFDVDTLTRVELVAVTEALRLAIEVTTTADWLATVELVATSDVATFEIDDALLAMLELLFAMLELLLAMLELLLATLVLVLLSDEPRSAIDAATIVDWLATVELVAVSEVATFEIDDALLAMLVLLFAMLVLLFATLTLVTDSDKPMLAMLLLLLAMLVLVLPSAVPRLEIDAATTVDWLATVELVAVSDVATLETDEPILAMLVLLLAMLVLVLPSAVPRLEIDAATTVDWLATVELVAVSEVATFESDDPMLAMLVLLFATLTLVTDSDKRMLAMLLLLLAMLLLLLAMLVLLFAMLVLLFATLTLVTDSDKPMLAMLLLLLAMLVLVLPSAVPRLEIDAATTVDWLATVELVAVSDVATLETDEPILAMLVLLLAMLVLVLPSAVPRLEIDAATTVDWLATVELVAVSEVATFESDDPMLAMLVLLFATLTLVTDSDKRMLAMLLLLLAMLLLLLAMLVLVLPSAVPRLEIDAATTID